MPGHKGKFPQLFGSFDPTELPGLDNLHSPQDTLRRAQNRVAKLYRVARTLFLINGSSVGIMAAINTLTGQGDCVLVPRRCHKSVLAGLVHSGAMPVWLEESLCPHTGHWLPPTAMAVKKLVEASPIKAAILTNPDYFGLAPDMPTLASVCKKEGVALIVDEAHGAHFNWGKGLDLPGSAVEAGCDIVVQSPHKTLPALTQAAWMHIKDPVLAEAVQEVLNLFQTTSPSYLLLGSLEFAGNWTKANGSIMLRRLRLLEKLLTLKCKQLGLYSYPPSVDRDWTKFILPHRRGILGLLHRQGIYPEMVQGDKVLFMLTMADAFAPEGIASLYRTLPIISVLPSGASLPELELPPLPCQEITPREAWKQRGKMVSLAKANGRIARQILAPYPPGTMVVAPGQRLEQEHVEYLQRLHARKVIPHWLEVI